jgi:uncharacterized protein DUF3592
VRGTNTTAQLPLLVCRFRRDMTNLAYRLLGRRSWIAWLAILVGVCWAAFNTVDVLHVARTTRWPVTAGVITAAVIRSDTVGVTITRTRLAPVVEDRLHLSYNYVVAVHTYTSTRLSVLPATTRDATFRALDAYRVGRKVAVHYDPTMPSFAVLDTSIPGGRIFQLVVGLAVAILTWIASRSAPETLSRPLREPQR